MKTQFRAELATLVDSPPEGPEWVHETKYDGYRMIAIRSGSSVAVQSRNGNDWTSKFPFIVRELQKLGSNNIVCDGEVVVLKQESGSAFSDLKNALSDAAKHQDLFRYFLFDLLFLNGRDLRGEPLSYRRTLLASLVKKSRKALRQIGFSESLKGSGAKNVQIAKRKGLEGIISKRLQSTYQAGRTNDWLKTKCIKRQEFVIGGFTNPEGSRSGFGALLLGYYDASGNLVYAGRVGTGFKNADLAKIAKLLGKPEANSHYARPLPALDRRGVHFVKPKLMAEIKFSEWTPDGRLRHPAFVALREDKESKSVHRDIPLQVKEAVTNAVVVAEAGSRPLSARKTRDQKTKRFSTLDRALASSTLPNEPKYRKLIEDKIIAAKKHRRRVSAEEAVAMVVKDIGWTLAKSLRLSLKKLKKR